mgnify:CR=1 FL=1
MTLLFAIAVYFVIWWIVLFAVLPFGVRTQHEAGEIVPGTPASAPAAPRMLRVAVFTSLIAALILGAIQTVIVYQLVDLAGLLGLRSSTGMP